MKAKALLFIPTIFAMAAFHGAAAEFSPDQLEFFEKKIRPVLAERCYECHSAVAEKLKAHLQVDHLEHLLVGGDTGASIVPGDPDASLIIEAISYETQDMQMPPKGQLSDTVVEDFKKWIADGAAWPDEPVPQRTGDGVVEKFDLEKRRAEHWCWRPIANPLPPSVSDAEWVKQPLDAFILSKIEAAGLKPAAPADKRTWVRRVYFDLIGLPPTRDQVAAFLADESPTAHETVVDGLLVSPHFGEKWARHWMDLVRYAESYGHEFDYPIHHAHEYRDYLIRAFNADVPYDQFLTEHVAGDLLQDPRRNPDEEFNESILGTAFWYLHEATHSPTDVRQDEADHMANQIDVFGKTFLGLTIACARCHDHKFDAISTADYYSLTTYLGSNARQEHPIDPGRVRETTAAQLLDLRERANAELVKVSSNYKPGNYFDVATDLIRTEKKPPAIGDETQWSVPGESKMAAAAMENGLDETRLAAWCRILVTPEDEKKRSNDVKHADAFFDKWINEQDPIPHLKNEITKAVDSRAKMEKRSTLLARFDGETLPEGWSTSGVAFQPTGNAAGVKFLEKAPLSTAGSVSSAVLGARQSGTLRSPTFKISSNQILVRTNAEQLFARIVIENYHMMNFNGLLFRGTVHKNYDSKGRFGWVAFSADLRKYVGLNAFIEFVDRDGARAEITEIWFSNEGPPAGEVDPIVIAAVQGEGTLSENLNDAWSGAIERLKNRTATVKDSGLVNWLVAKDLISLTDLSPALAEIHQSGIELAAALSPERYGIAMAKGTPQGSHVYIRGSYRNLGEPVSRRMITALGGKEGDRLTLANEMTTLENPLTSRVIVNRIWHHIFGRGLVATVDDFGPMGQEPSHPELLDYLATDFVKNEWSMKSMIRKVVLSQTYRQSSVANEALDSQTVSLADPENVLLHRMPVRRLSAEEIRDSMLAISGRLDPKLFGASVPTHRTRFMSGRGAKGSGPLDGAGRRSVYGAIYRNFLSPMMLAFDMPGPFGPKGRRSVSNVPAQSLALMNDPFVIEQAKLWAKKSLAKDASFSPETRIVEMYEAAFAALPDENELAAIQQFLNQQAAEYGGALDERAWADVAHVMFNLKEFLYLN